MHTVLKALGDIYMVYLFPREILCEIYMKTNSKDSILLYI